MIFIDPDSLTLTNCATPLLNTVKEIYPERSGKISIIKEEEYKSEFNYRVISIRFIRYNNIL